ncbi:MAG: histidine phosphatase family protein [Burkholderiales bacterium]|nr:histidine phosphatase family protein [Burkholderiales bacterium]
MPRQAGVRILYFRHGQSEANVARQISDDPSRIVNLTDTGRVQAQGARDLLSGIELSCAYASEFPRAQQTASILLNGGEFRVDSRINERKSGMDGRSVQEFNDLVRNDPAGFCPPGGESFFDEMQRVKDFMDEMAERHSGGTILAVSHENPILAALALCGQDPAEAALGDIANCEKIEVTWPRS